MQLVHVSFNWFLRNLLLKCVTQPEIAKNPLKKPILAIRLLFVSLTCFAGGRGCVETKRKEKFLCFWWPSVLKQCNLTIVL